jgi:hypothetical protein
VADHPLSFARRALRELVLARLQLERLERALVIHARYEGASWREIGDDLGISLQSAWSRHVAADPRSRPPRRDYFEEDMAAAKAFLERSSAPPEGV